MSFSVKLVTMISFSLSVVYSNMHRFNMDNLKMTFTGLILADQNSNQIWTLKTLNAGLGL